MRTFILDATIWLAAHDPQDEAHAASRDLVLNGTFDLAALDLTLYEVSNIATTKWHDADVADRLTRLVTLAADTRLIRVDAQLLQLATSIAVEHRLSVYDAAYAAAGRQTGWDLISTESDLTAPGLAITPREIT